MLKIAICDDEIIIASEIENRLSKLAKKSAIETEIEIFSDGSTLVESIQAGMKCDIVYLDIQMQRENGITAAKKIREIDANVLIIYISGYVKFVEDVFEVDAFDFIRKPINEERFQKCFFRAYKRICCQRMYFEHHYKNENLKVPMGEILYFESRGRKIKVHLIDKTVEVFNDKLDSVEQEVKKSKIAFLRIHKSYMVSFHFIRVFSRTAVRLVNGEVLPISRERYSEIIERYGKLVGGEVSD